LIIVGGEDRGRPGALALQQRIPGCQLVTLEGAGHACFMDQPWTRDAAALQFLREHNLVEDGSIRALRR
jgi:pimeloyl-ACP methyl ester carboxylesterase